MEQATNSLQDKIDRLDRKTDTEPGRGSQEAARDGVARQQRLWAEKFRVDEVIKPATDVSSAALFSEIREYVGGLKQTSRISFLEKHATDPVVASALLTAPAFLSGLTDAEVALVRHRIERSIIPPEVVEAKADAERALAEAEQGWTRAMQMIAERGGLDVVQSSKAKPKAA